MPKTKLVPDSEAKLKTKPVVVEEYEEEMPKKEEISKKEETPKKKEFKDSDGVKCRSVVSGNLFVEGLKTKMIYTWTDYGDETEMEYRDIVAAVRSRDKSVYEPRFIVEDKDFLAEFPALEKFYSDRFTTKDIKAILNMPINEMLEAIEKLPNGAVDSLKTIAAKQVASGELDSINKIKALDKLFGTDLNLIGSFTDEN